MFGLPFYSVTKCLNHTDFFLLLCISRFCCKNDYRKWLFKLQMLQTWGIPQVLGVAKNPVKVDKSSWGDLVLKKTFTESKGFFPVFRQAPNINASCFMFLFAIQHSKEPCTSSGNNPPSFLPYPPPKYPKKAKERPRQPVFGGALRQSCPDGKHLPNFLWR